MNSFIQPKHKLNQETKRLLNLYYYLLMAVINIVVKSIVMYTHG